MIELRCVNKVNFSDVISLYLDPEDQSMINSNLYSLAESYVNSNMVPRVVYHNEEVVGFLLYEISLEEHFVEIHRVMIADNYQRKGYGRRAIHLLLEEIKHISGIDYILICYAPNNKKAIPLYRELGFRETGATTVDEGTGKVELVARLDI